MNKSMLNLLVIVAMLVTFVGQAMAYTTMACDMSAKNHQGHGVSSQSVMDHSEMDHSEMGHSVMQHDMMQAEVSSSDCCDVECMCPQNACTSATFLNDASINFDIAKLNEPVISIPLEFPRSSITNLFRPPIFA